MRIKPLGLALAGASFVLLALSMHALLRGASCTGACDASGWMVLGLPAGILAGPAGR